MDLIGLYPNIFTSILAC